jgi:hypothetical protein
MNRNQLFSPLVLGTLLLGAGHADALAPHEPIQIKSDLDLLLPALREANGVTGGTGLPGDPVIISGWEIEAGLGSGLEISGTTLEILIEDVVIRGQASDDSEPAVRILSVNGVTLKDMLIEGSRKAISSFASDLRVRNATMWGPDPAKYGNHSYGISSLFGALDLQDSTIAQWVTGVGMQAGHVAGNRFENVEHALYVGTGNASVVGNRFLGLAPPVGACAADPARFNREIETPSAIVFYQDGGHEVILRDNYITGFRYGISFGSEDEPELKAPASLRIENNTLLRNVYAVWGMAPPIQVTLQGNLILENQAAITVILDDGASPPPLAGSANAIIHNVDGLVVKSRYGKQVTPAGPAQIRLQGGDWVGQCSAAVRVEHPSYGIPDLRGNYWGPGGPNGTGALVVGPARMENPANAPFTEHGHVTGPELGAPSNNAPNMTFAALVVLIALATWARTISRTRMKAVQVGMMLALGLLLLAPQLPALPSSSHSSSGEAGPRGNVSVSHDPIVIMSDADLLLPDALSGNGVVGGIGTQEYPYLIAGWEITAVAEPALTIANTRAHIEVFSVHAFADDSAPTLRIVNATNIRIINSHFYGGNTSAYLDRAEVWLYSVHLAQEQRRVQDPGKVPVDHGVIAHDSTILGPGFSVYNARDGMLLINTDLDVERLGLMYYGRGIVLDATNKDGLFRVAQLTGRPSPWMTEHLAIEETGCPDWRDDVGMGPLLEVVGSARAEVQIGGWVMCASTLLRVSQAEGVRSNITWREFVASRAGQGIVVHSGSPAIVVRESVFDRSRYGIILAGGDARVDVERTYFGWAQVVAMVGADPFGCACEPGGRIDIRSSDFYANRYAAVNQGGTIALDGNFYDDRGQPGAHKLHGAGADAAPAHQPHVDGWSAPYEPNFYPPFHVEEKDALGFPLLLLVAALAIAIRGRCRAS